MPPTHRTAVYFLVFAPGCIQVSEVTHALLPNHPFTATGGVEVKGKGLMQTYILDPEVRAIVGDSKLKIHV